MIQFECMKKEFILKSRGLYPPKDDKPFKVSRSGIELFTECPCCFYLNNVKGIRRPSGPPFNINKAVDTLLKKEFDVHREKKTPHPYMKQYGLVAVPFQHEMMDEWRENFKGVQYLHAPTNFIVTGAVDNYLHEMALANQPPSKTVYDPDKKGKPLASLGVHEHWNNAADKKYSRNLGSGAGIELVALNVAPAPVVTASTR